MRYQAAPQPVDYDCCMEFHYRFRWWHVPVFLLASFAFGIGRAIGYDLMQTWFG